MHQSKMMGAPALFISCLSLSACGSNNYGLHEHAPQNAPVASVDRFQDGFATLFKRSAPAFNPTAVAAAIPAPNAPIDLDKFLVKSFGPAGERVTYYSLDIIDPHPQTVYTIVGADKKPVPGQLPIFSGVPGDKGYSDFARVTTVEVDDSYRANSIASVADVDSAVQNGAKKTVTDQIVNWSLVPMGTTATLKFLGRDPTGHRGWVNGMVVSYLEFETNLVATGDGLVPAVAIVVIFADDKSPAGGFAMEPSGQTHNVVALLPGQPGYSSFWDHSVGNLAGFASVHDLPTAEANVKAKVPVIVNCPVVAP